MDTIAAKTITDFLVTDFKSSELMKLVKLSVIFGDEMFLD